MRHRFNTRNTSNVSTIITKIVVISVVVYALIVSFRSLQHSSFFAKKDRVNIVFYGEQPIIVSFGIADNVNYTVDFNNTHQVIVPGGYGRYSVGALGKLAQIQDQYPIIQRAFSSMISAYVDYYSVPINNIVNDSQEVYRYNKFDLIKRIISHKYKTNISFFEKMYLSYLLLTKREVDMIPIQGTAIYNPKLDTYAFSENGFLKKYRGFFYHASLREEGKEVKILYTKSYKAAANSARVIEGQGIRIADVGEYTGTQINTEKNFNCELQYPEQNKNSLTLAYLHDRFGCRQVVTQTEGADMLLILGKTFENQWE